MCVDRIEQFQIGCQRELLAVRRGLPVVFEARQHGMVERSGAEGRLRLVVDIETVVVELKNARIARDRCHGRVGIVESAAVHRPVVGREMHEARSDAPSRHRRTDARTGI